MRSSTSGPGRRRRPKVDFEEVRPHIFWVHEPGIKPILKNEGTFNGPQFELTSWRREGLMARLRERGFTVQTLADQVDALPNPPNSAPIGKEVIRALVTPIERFSYFDALALTWVPITAYEHDGQQVVTLRDGWAVRRRKGRGAAEFYVAFAERGGTAGLRPTEEIKALMLGFAQATSLRERELTARRIDSKYYLLPDIILPSPYRTVLARIAEQTPDGWRVHERGWPLAQELFAHLGLLLNAIETQPERTAAQADKPGGTGGKRRR